MIKLIVAIDSLRGIANEAGIPWNLPSDSAYYKKKVSNGKVLMGYGTYLKHETTLHGATEYVATRRSKALRAGFEPIADIESFFTKNSRVWVLGGAELFNDAIGYADMLYVTQVDGNFNCTKFFPAFEKDFVLVSKSPIHKENGALFQYQVWKSKRLADSSNIIDF